MEGVGRFLCGSCGGLRGLLRWSWEAKLRLMDSDDDGAIFFYYGGQQS